MVGLGTTWLRDEEAQRIRGSETRRQADPYDMLDCGPSSGTAVVTATHARYPNPGRLSTHTRAAPFDHMQGRAGSLHRGGQVVCPYTGWAAICDLLQLSGLLATA